MKKLVVFSLIAVIVAGAAFAQMADGIKLGAWGRTIFVPLEVELYKEGAPDGQDDDVALGSAMGFPGQFGRSVRLNFSGTSENIGFITWIQTDGSIPGPGGVNIGDNAQIWVKPFDMLKIEMGKFVNNTLRGKIGDTDWGDMTIGHNTADFVFTRFTGGNSTHPYSNIGDVGVMFTVTPPVDGLFIGYGIPRIGAVTGWGAKYPTKAADAFSLSQFAVGYTIEDIGLARVQFIDRPNFDFYKFAAGNNLAAIRSANGGADAYDNFKRIEAAFALTMLEGMTVDVGFKIRLPEKGYGALPGQNKDNKDEYSVNPPISANIGYMGAFGDIGVTAHLGFNFLGKSTVDYDAGGDATWNEPINFNFYVVPTYNLGFAVVGLEAGLRYTGEGKYETSGADVTTDAVFNMGVGGFIQKNFGANGYIKAGVTFTSLDVGDDKDAGGNKMHSPNGYIRIPILATVIF